VPTPSQEETKTGSLNSLRYFLKGNKDAKPKRWVF